MVERVLVLGGYKEEIFQKINSNVIFLFVSKNIISPIKCLIKMSQQTLK